VGHSRGRLRRVHRWLSPYLRNLCRRRVHLQLVGLAAVRGHLLLRDRLRRVEGEEVRIIRVDAEGYLNKARSSAIECLAMDAFYGIEVWPSHPPSSPYICTTGRGKRRSLASCFPRSKRQQKRTTLLAAQEPPASCRKW
jgi:hypothetical protein